MYSIIKKLRIVLWSFDSLDYRCRNSKELLENIRRAKIEPGDIIIISCETFFNCINNNISKYSYIINNKYSAPLNDLKSILVKSIMGKVPGGDEGGAKDKLLILIGMKEVA